MTRIRILALTPSLFFALVLSASSHAQPPRQEVKLAKPVDDVALGHGACL